MDENMAPQQPDREVEELADALRAAYEALAAYPEQTDVEFFLPAQAEVVLSNPA